MNTADAVSTRRSIKKFTGRSVTREEIETRLAAAGLKDNERIVAVVNIREPAEVPAAKKREPATAFATWRNRVRAANVFQKCVVS